MLTHYFRKKIQVGQTHLSPEGELVTLNTIVGNVMCNKENDCIRKPQEVQTLLDDLVKYKLVGSVHGERLYRFCKDF